LQTIRITAPLFILVVFCIAVGHGHCGSPGSDRDGQSELRAEIRAMKDGNPDKYRDFQYALRHIRRMNRRQEEWTSLVVAKALVDHVHWERYRFASEEHRLNFLSVLMGIIRVESGFNPAAVSNKNARGLMQVHWPTWKQHFSSPEQAHDLNKNLSVGTGILRLYMRQSNNNLRLALYKYLGTKDDRYADRVIEGAMTFKMSVLSNPLKSPLEEKRR